MRCDRTQLSIYVVAGLLVADFIWFAYIPSQQRLGALRRSLMEHQAAMARAQAARSRLPSLRAQVEAGEDQMARCQELVPARRDLGTFLRQAAELMTLHHLTDQLMAPDKEVQGDMVNGVPVSLRCRGRIAGVFGFLRDLQGLPRQARLDSMRLVNDPNLSGDLRMEAKVTVFYRPKALAREASSSL